VRRSQISGSFRTFVSRDSSGHPNSSRPSTTKSPTGEMGVISGDEQFPAKSREPPANFRFPLRLYHEYSKGRAVVTALLPAREPDGVWPSGVCTVGELWSLPSSRVRAHGQHQKKSLQRTPVTKEWTAGNNLGESAAACIFCGLGAGNGRGSVVGGGGFGLEIEFAVGAACFDVQPVCHTRLEWLWTGLV